MGRKSLVRKPGFRRCWLSCTLHCSLPPGSLHSPLGHGPEFGRGFHEFTASK